MTLSPITVRAPWPPHELSPNDRSPNWLKRKKKRSHRSACFMMAKAANHCRKIENQPLTFHMICHPPKQRWDDDNLIAAMKAGRDGIAEALGVNDKNFKVTMEWAKPVAFGRIDVLIGPRTEAAI
ncbi:hypothetical protein [Cereibacter changlensis]|uniref:hypothetical protein n=1 Tax=Cereibacter changlensis TaxID=402884 RepID=UPI004034C930